MSDSKLVFSTGEKKPQKKPTEKPKFSDKNQMIYLKYEKKGRKGKGVTIIEGLPLDKPQLKELSSQIKTKCSTGGTIKGNSIEIQGDFRDIIKLELEKKSYKVKLSGG